MCNHYSNYRKWGEQSVEFCLSTCKEKISSDGSRDHANPSNWDICLFLASSKPLHTKKNVCIIESVHNPSPWRVSRVVRGHRLFSFFSLSSRWIILLFSPPFTPLHFVSNSALCLFFHTSLCQCFLSHPDLRKLPHLLFFSLRHGGKSLYCFSRSLCFPLSAYSLWLCQSMFSHTCWKSIHAIC